MLSLAKAKMKSLKDKLLGAPKAPTKVENTENYKETQETA